MNYATIEMSISTAKGLTALHCLDPAPRADLNSGVIACFVALNTIVDTCCCSRLLILKRTSSYLLSVPISFCCDAVGRRGRGVPCLFQEARHTGLHLFCTMMYTRPSVLPKFPVVHCSSIRYTIFYGLFYFLHRFVCPR